MRAHAQCGDHEMMFWLASEKAVDDLTREMRDDTQQKKQSDHLFV